MALKKSIGVSKCVTMGPTSLAVTRRLSQSTRGSTLRMNSGWKSNSCCSSSASWKCSGKEAAEVLHSLTAQVTKLAVMTFMVGGGGLVLKAFLVVVRGRVGGVVFGDFRELPG